jgi:hypothetical protein
MLAAESAAAPAPALPTTQVGAIPTTTEMAERSTQEPRKDQEPSASLPFPTKTPSGNPTLWALTPDFAGPIRKGQNIAAQVPGLGNVAPEVQQAVTYVDNSRKQLIKNLQTNPRFSDSERESIDKDTKFGASFLGSAASMENRLISIDSYLLDLQMNEEKAAKDEKLPTEDRKNALIAANEFKNFRSILGVPRVSTREEVKALPIGTRFVYKGFIGTRDPEKK